MKSNCVVMVAVVLTSLMFTGCRGNGERVDLISVFDGVQKRPDASAFSVGEVTLNNETRRAIAVSPLPGSRLTWKVKVPEDGWLNVAVGMKPEAWEKEGNGVLFTVGISDGRAYDPLFSQHVNPFANTADRRWIPVWVDVSAYGGEEVDVILNTLASPAKQEADLRNDLAVWGEPIIVVR
jgi:hypothetical protein